MPVQKPYKLAKIGGCDVIVHSTVISMIDNVQCVDGDGTAARMSFEDLHAVRSDEGSDSIKIGLGSTVAVRILLRSEKLTLIQGRIRPMLVIRKGRTTGLAAKN